jgi:hypothetical protein
VEQGVDILAFISDAGNITKLWTVLDAAETMLHKPSEEQLDPWYEQMHRANRKHYDVMNEVLHDPKALEAWVAVKYPGQEVCPPISRDTGAGILRIIADAAEPVPILKQIEFLKEGFCKWAYIVDLDTEVFEVYTRWRDFETISQSAERLSTFSEVEFTNRC